MEDGDSLYARIAELERELNYLKALYSYNIGILDYSIAEFQKENEKLKKEKEFQFRIIHALYNVWDKAGMEIVEMKDYLLLLYSKDFVKEHFEELVDIFESDFEDEDEDSDDEEEDEQDE